VTDECTEFEGQYSLMLLYDVFMNGYTGCEVCRAGEYESIRAEIEASVTPEPTEEPTAEPTEEPTEEPTAEPTEEPTPEPTEEPTPEPTAEPTPEPTFAPGEVPHKSAGEAIVYHTSNGRSYHEQDCRTMSGAKPYTLAESIADGFGACGVCDVPDPSMIDMPVVWIDEENMGHVSDKCPQFNGEYNLVTLYEACAMEELVGCEYCGCDEYISAEKEKLDELAKQTVVYYNDGSTYYHSASSCVNMPTADEHNLYDALEKGLKHCKRCDPATMEDLAMEQAAAQTEGEQAEDENTEE